MYSIIIVGDVLSIGDEEGSNNSGLHVSMRDVYNGLKLAPHRVVVITEAVFMRHLLDRRSSSITC